MVRKLLSGAKLISHSTFCSWKHIKILQRALLLSWTHSFQNVKKLACQMALVAILLQSRRIQNVVMLEASIENTSKSPLVLDHLRFDPEPHMSAEELKIAPVRSSTESPHRFLQEYMQDLKVGRPLDLWGASRRIPQSSLTCLQTNCLSNVQRA